jgi:glycosyltransferase involved in cell wall biosynthesis
MSSTKPKILFICRKQFGYSVDNYYHCKYLSEEFDITYLSPDVGWEKINIEKVTAKYQHFGSNRVYNNITFYIKAIFEIENGRYDLVILNRSYLFFIFALFNPGQKFTYDIRSGVVSPSFIKRHFYTWLIKLDLLFYKNITVISESLAKKLRLRIYHVLPLGADSFNLPPKDFKNLSFVYTGTFNNRNIHQTIQGFSLFLKGRLDQNRYSYHIYGFGAPENELLIKKYIEDFQLNNHVFLHGRYAPKDLSSILMMHNIGVSYVPVTSYFNVQPPTKTFEYLLAGMPVIATNTFENKKVINEKNGILTDDNAQSFCDAMNVITERINNSGFNSYEIVQSSSRYSWKFIVKEIFAKQIHSFLQTN